MSTLHLHLTYDLPPCSPLTDKDAQRLEHEDLESMTRPQLETEAWRTRLTLCFADLSHPSWAESWLEERLERCKAEIRRRP